jgi:hypothetical protein
MPAINKSEYPKVCSDCKTSTMKLRRPKPQTSMHRGPYTPEYYACDCRRYSFSPSSTRYNDRGPQITPKPEEKPVKPSQMTLVFKDKDKI